jgi:hypothetical protein
VDFVLKDPREKSQLDDNLSESMNDFLEYLFSLIDLKVRLLIGEMIITSADNMFIRRYFGPIQI